MRGNAPSVSWVCTWIGTSGNSLRSAPMSMLDDCGVSRPAMSCEAQRGGAAERGDSAVDVRTPLSPRLWGRQTRGHVRHSAAAAAVIGCGCLLHGPSKRCTYGAPPTPTPTATATHLDGQHVCARLHEGACQLQVVLKPEAGQSNGGKRK